MVVTMLYAWLRRGELLGLRWRDVELGHPEGPRLHVRETWVRGHRSDPKTDEGSRTIALDAPLADALFEHMARSAYRGAGRSRVLSSAEGIAGSERLLRADREAGAGTGGSRAADEGVP